ncbi:hypothetical protein [Pseudomonas syringae]|uniref:hypothetical protein n=1 Tax=Pseudomonas syringae TaxID=317 RepID=UPI00245B11CD|nr:hypothetical protein [Pseudomonas syringae]MDH4602459.1 hypothetical protein [Pseudomonas syringae pv. papulans]
MRNYSSGVIKNFVLAYKTKFTKQHEVKAVPIKVGGFEDWKCNFYRSINRNLKVISSTLASLSLVFFSRAASAKFSDLAPDWKVELGAVAQIVLLGIAAVGVCTAGMAVITGIKAKKDGRPLEWQTWGFIGGALATVIPFFILAMAGSLTGDDGNGQSSLNELNLK